MLQRMRFLLVELLSILFLISSFTSLTASAFWFEDQTLAETPQVWEIEQGDWIIANVKKNTLQFVRDDSSAMSRPIRIGSGINDGRMMNYLGMTYDPTTPEKVWEIREKNQQNWWNVFGTREADEQLFLRLYEVQGDQRTRTHYGIHTTPDIETIFAEQDGYGSWGCLITRYELLKKIEDLYDMNDGVVRVVTTRLASADVMELAADL